MSGGVDSSVAAHLIAHRGTRSDRRVHAPRRNGRSRLCVAWQIAPAGARTRADHKQGCCSASDAADARRVADRLDIPFYALDMSAEFGRIIDYFVAEYRQARTPNPCVMCNNWLKFGKMFDFADSIGAEFVATGHYARLEQDGETVDGVNGAAERAAPRLRRGLDDGKDQSYVLFGVERRYLPRMLFPVGGYHKHEIRKLALELELRVADKRDSQEICFRHERRSCPVRPPPWRPNRYFGRNHPGRWNHRRPPRRH